MRLFLLLLLVGLCSHSLYADRVIAHQFSEITFSDQQWKLKTSGSYWSTLYSSTLSTTTLHFKNKFGGESYSNRGAYTWNAPEGQIIVGVKVKGEVAGYLTTFNAAIFASSSKNANINDYSLEWTKYATIAGPWNSEVKEIQIDQSRGIKSIGLGFSDVQSDNSHQVRFSDVTIYTIPDVEILAATYRHNFVNTPMTPSKWKYTYTGAYGNILYDGVLNQNSCLIHNVYGGESYPNRSAFKWHAPANEVITRVTFVGEVVGYLKEFNAALFTNTDTVSSLDAYAVQWKKYSPYAGPWHKENVTREFLPQENIKSIALGIFDTKSDNTHQAQFSNVIIETQSLSDATYDYSDGQINHSDDWKLKTSGLYWGTIYSGNTSENEITFKNKYGGESYANSGAYVWDAPKNALITGIRFKGEVIGYLDDFKATLFTSQSSNSSIDNYYSGKWQKSTTVAGNWHSQDVYLTFSPTENIKSIGLGFKDVLSDPTHQVKFSDITIITSPIVPSTSVSRGTDIIRSKGFRVDSYVDLARHLNINDYKSYELNGINFRLGSGSGVLEDDFWNANKANTFGAAHYGNLPWTWFQNYHGGDYSKIVERAVELDQDYGATAYGYCVGDEYMFKGTVTNDFYANHHNQGLLNIENNKGVITPLKDVFPESDTLIQLGKLLNEIKSKNNNQLVYTVTAPMAMKYNQHHNYLAYLDRSINNARPDILNYDHYPFINGKLDGYFYHNLHLIRLAALTRGIPYSSWIQSCGSDLNDTVLHTSESELRFQAFTCLTYGFSMLSYWTYHSLDDDLHRSSIRYFIENDTLKESPIGIRLRTIIPEVKIIGNELIQMKSSALFYYRAGLESKPHEIPLWTTQSDPRIVAINSPATNKGFFLGFFKKDNEASKYLMITNTKCGYTQNASAASQKITVQFKNDISYVDRLNRSTGTWDRINLTNNTLSNYTLPGGTGDLFKLPY